MTDKIESNIVAETLMEYHGRLLDLAKRHLNPVMASRVTPEDVVQDTLSAASQRVNFLENHPEVPVYFKLRMLFFQTLATLERYHLRSQKRDAYKEVSIADTGDEKGTCLSWEQFADAATGPLTRMLRKDRYELLKRALENLSESDRQMLEMRHFDNLTNAECAEVLHITVKAASIRYVRALERLQQHLSALTEFCV